jgi:Domain of unknown function (DUF6438)
MSRTITVMSVVRAGLSASLCASLFAACASQQTQAAEQLAIAMADTSAAVSLARGACHGTCPIYSVQIGEKGGVRFAGTRFVRQVGRDSATVSPANVHALRAAFVSRKFDAVPPVIEYGSPACGTSYVADLPTNELTLTSAGSSHRVRWDEGCRTHPPMLDTLARMVDSVSGTSRWIPQSRP